jgi:hypothetical protein
MSDERTYSPQDDTTNINLDDKLA